MIESHVVEIIVVLYCIAVALVGCNVFLAFAIAVLLGRMGRIEATLHDATVASMPPKRRRLDGIWPYQTPRRRVSPPSRLDA